MMAVCENDILTIPERYKEMSASELEEEKLKVLDEIKAVKRTQKVSRKGKNNTVFNLNFLEL